MRAPWAYQYVHEYLSFARATFTHTREGGTVQLSWSSRPLSAPDWRQEFQRALDRRINLKTSEPKSRGRKDEPEYQDELYRDRRALQDYLERRIVPRRAGGGHIGFRTALVQRRLGRLLNPIGGDERGEHADWRRHCL